MARVLNRQDAQNGPADLNAVVFDGGPAGARAMDGPGTSLAGCHRIVVRRPDINPRCHRVSTGLI
jgi:hypothetical protein